MQDDILFSTFKCEEALRFAAKLRMNGSKAEVSERVDKIIKELALVKCRNTIIGGGLIKGLSGGERKRTSIGVELITDPSIIFLDEPTSGLDSFTAKRIVKMLVRLANQGKAVISTIHQPSSDTFKEFDKLLLVAEGNIIYQGKARDAFDYFKGIGFVIPRISNPADYFLKEFYVPYKPNPIVRKKLDMVYDSYDKEIKPEIMKKIDTSSKGVD